MNKNLRQSQNDIRKLHIVKKDYKMIKKIHQNELTNSPKIDLAPQSFIITPGMQFKTSFWNRYNWRHSKISHLYFLAISFFTEMLLKDMKYMHNVTIVI